MAAAETTSPAAEITQTGGTPSDPGAAAAPALNAVLLPILGLMAISLSQGIGMGASLPLISQILKSGGHGEHVIGIVTSVASLGALTAAPLVATMQRVIGMRATIVAAMLGFAAINLVLIPVVDPVPMALLRALAVVFVTMAWVSSETWTVQLTPPGYRGRIMAVYALCFFGGSAIGPLLLLETGFSGPAPFVTLAIISCLAILPQLLLHRGLPRPISDRESAGLRQLLRVITSAPVIVSAGLVAGMVELTVYSLGVLHWQNVGYSLEDASRLLSAFGIGGVGLVLALGAVSDRMGSPRSLLVFAVAGIVPAVTLSWWAGLAFWPQLAVTMVWGGFGTAIYTLALVSIGSRFSGPQLTAANAAVVLAYTLGVLTGPPAAGLAQRTLPETGMLWAVGVCCLSFVALVIAVGMARRRRAARAAAASAVSP